MSGAEAGPGSHATETINAVISDLVLARIAINAETQAGWAAIATKLVVLAGELTELADMLGVDHS